MCRDPQRFIGKNVIVTHFNPVMVKYTSPGSVYSESKNGNPKLLPFPKSSTKESNLDHFRDLAATGDASCWLYKAISLSLLQFGDDRSCDF